MSLLMTYKTQGRVPTLSPLVPRAFTIEAPVSPPWRNLRAIGAIPPDVSRFTTLVTSDGSPLGRTWPTLTIGRRSRFRTLAIGHRLHQSPDVHVQLTRLCQSVDDDDDDDGTATECREERDNPPVEIPTLGVQGFPEVSFESLREAQLADETMAPVLRWKEEGDRPDWQTVTDKSLTLKTYLSQWDMLAVKDGVLVKRWESDDGREFRWLLALPRSLRRQVLDMLHSSKTANHLGREKTMLKVRERRTTG